ncbi:hypothetical protein GCM10022281_23030 [Sphingomonas rosea]|uniref:AAA+ ATPase domain-containing protein n=1 Tax=Sphingomonas rosea TaxID=335605 RepID=A0ABP7UE78_9SPHN
MLVSEHPLTYRWMLREPAWETAKDLGLAADAGREPQGDPFPDFMVNTVWVQDADNQRAMLDGFARELAPEHSLVFFYAKRTPLAESGSAIVAVALLEHVGRVDEYPYKGGAAGGRVQSMVWERPFQHSLRTAEGGFTGGVVLPYQQILELAEADPELDAAHFLAVPPEDARGEFLYGSEHVGHGSAISALLAVRTAVERCSALVPGNWGEAIGWIDARINDLWRLRGPAPGLGSALTCIEPASFNGTLFAHAVQDNLPPDADPWPTVIDIFAGRRPQPFSAPPLSTLPKRRFELIRTNRPEQFALIQMLSRFELTKTQAVAAFDAEDPMRAVKNPYVLFEESRFWDEPVPLSRIDQGLYGGGGAVGAWPLPSATLVDPTEPDHPLRLRASAVEVLERAAAAGDTLLRGADIAAAAAELPLSPPVPLDEIALELLERDFYPAVNVEEADGSWTAQLERYVEAGTVIRSHVSARLDAPADAVHVDWRKLLEAEWGGIEEGEEVEEKAREEKSAALKTLTEHRLAVLTGPAGSGKTSLLKLLLRRRDIVGGDVALLAPTGKARVRLGAQTGMRDRARTLAQFLKEQERWNPETDEYSFRSSGATARVSTCVVDEASMLTEDQLAALFSALPKKARVILVGDPRQLPPIGAGRPLVDLIAHLEESHAGAGVASLEVGRRQGKDGKPVAAALLPDVQLAQLFSGRILGPGEDEIAGEILSGQAENRLRTREWDTSPRLREVLADVLAEELGSVDGDLERAVDLSLGGKDSDRMYFNLGAGANVERWQVLTTYRDLPNGSGELNRHLKRVARARKLRLAREGDRGWRVVEPRGADQVTYGDKVICLQNHSRDNWDGKAHAGYLANGEVGLVVGGTGHSRPSWTNVEFSTQPGLSYGFRARDFADHASPILELGYAITIHKAQGSEFGAVILVLPANSRMLSRELLYTALTRQQNSLWILHQGPLGAFLRFRSDFYSETARRTTNLFAPPSMVQASPPAGAPPATRRTFLEHKLIHATRRGDLVSSKNEVIIADILNELEQEGWIRYSVEKPLVLAGIERWPDFTVEHGGDVWYWEHCGKLDDPGYRSRWERKKAGYAKEGIDIWASDNPTGRLIVTTDGPEKGVDSGSLAELARRLWF